MNFMVQFFANLLKNLQDNDQLIATILETAAPQEAPMIALADAIYQAEKKNPTALKGLTFPLSIKGQSYTVTIS